MHEQPGGRSCATPYQPPASSPTRRPSKHAGIAISLVLRVPTPLKSLADQVIRSASSVPANLSEGHGRSGRDRMHHWRIAYARRKRSTPISSSSSRRAPSTLVAPNPPSGSSTKLEPSPGVSSTQNHDCDDCRAGVPPAHQSPRRSASRSTPFPRRSRLRRDVVPGFPKQHLCHRDLTKVRIPRIRGHDPHDSRSPNPYLPELRSKQRVTRYSVVIAA